MVLVFGAGLLPDGGRALAQSGSQGEVQGLINRVDRLQRELTTLQRQVYRGGVPAGRAAVGGPGADSPGLITSMQVRLDEIETEMRRFTGRMEELQHGTDTLKRQLEKLASDIDFRLKRLEAGQPQGGAPAAAAQGAAVAGAAPAAQGAQPGSASAAPGRGPAPLKPQMLGTVPRGDLERQRQRAAPSSPPTPAPAAAPRPRAAATATARMTPEAQYKHATDLLFRSDYAGAEQSLAAFVKAHPKHKLSGNAQYWLGETHYARGAYRAAAAVFAEGYQKYPDSSKGPDNLLKLGMSLVAIDKKASACTTFARLLKEYPKASSAVRSSARSQHKKLRCR
jgi:tol-pal system protein YbgF